ncbi:NACHT domain-containing protein [Ancylothrix sp. C2]|uniref:NACHT and WD40 repeat domain-containing protein n=1 Tax=Ancylothrix sp. D3o TaxID=2953691 RepID=UPI0021BB165C|nr:NACHT domain-containing protein [Ancylothrix sp. D3o]MCT7950084.1 NACHT domain-containing protein [Ancylothrix sp. D3o]
MKIRMQQILEFSAPQFARQNVQTRYQLLWEVQKEVQSRLDQSLHRLIWQKNKLQDHSESTRSWDVEVKIGNLPSERLLPETKLIELFDLPAVAGKLVILGASGAGKTTSLLELTSALAFRAEKDTTQPVPVPLNLCSWHGDCTLFEWLVNEIYIKYGLIPETTALWLKNRQLIPLLDGFSELKTELQKPCLQTINEYLETFQPQHLVVCCGLTEYAAAKTLLSLNAAIYFLPLNETQIQTYLSSLGLQQLWQQFQQDPFLLNWAKTPLFLNIIILAAEEIWLDEWRGRTSPESRCRYLLDAFIRYQLKQEPTQQFYPTGTPPTPEKTKHWLGWLAQCLKRQYLEEFLIEKIQPHWLTVPLHRWLYRFGVAWVVGSIGALSSALSFGPAAGILAGLFFALLGGLCFTIEPAEPINWSWEKALKGVSLGLLLGLGCGLLIALFLSTILQQFSEASFGISRALVGGLIGGLIFGLSQGLNDPEIKTRTVPNQGIWHSASTAAIFTLISGVTFGLSLGIFGGIMSGLGGLGFGILAGLACGGIACIQHLILRGILYAFGYIPWNYAQFLNYANSLGFLQRAGGRYRFVHDMVRANFAAPPLAEIVLRKTSTQIANTVAGHSDYVQAVAISPDGQMVISGSDDRTIKLWKMVAKEGGSTLQPIRTLAGHLGYVRTLAISPDGQLLASGSNDKTIKIWHLGGVGSIPQGTVLFSLNGHNNWVRTVAFSPDGQLLASSGDDKVINIWYLPTGQLLNSYPGHSDYIRSLAFTPDGKYLASASDDATVNVWEINSNGGLKEMPYLTLEGHAGYVRCLAISGNGQFLVSASDDQTITVWQLAKGDLLREPGTAIHLLGGHLAPVWSLAISPDGKTLASCSKDKTIKLWRLYTGELLKTIPLGQAGIFSIVFSSDGRYLIGGSQDKTLKILPVN